jgi:hypothetical protein
MFDFKDLFSTFNSDYSYSANKGSERFPVPAYCSLNTYIKRYQQNYSGLKLNNFYF